MCVPDCVFSADRRSVGIDGATDGLSNRACEGDTSRSGTPSALHADKMLVEFLCQMGGYESQRMGVSFCMVERNAEEAATGTTIETGVGGVCCHIVKDLAFLGDGGLLGGSGGGHGWLQGPRGDLGDLCLRGVYGV